jgi:hypothetical protein
MNIASEQYARFYELEVLEGELFSENDSKQDVMLNESAVKAFGWDRAAGKLLDNYRVKGVFRNIYNASPTIAAKPVLYRLSIVIYELRITN